MLRNRYSNTLIKRLEECKKIRKIIVCTTTDNSVDPLTERLRENYPKLRVLFLTATPIINNLTEGVKLFNRSIFS